MSDLVEQIDALLALNTKGAVSHPVPGLAVELLERAMAELAARRVGVKELVWTEYPNVYSPDVFGHFWDGDTVLSRYTIEEESASDTPRYTLSIGQGYALLSVHDSVEEAKAAAQADFNARIQSCLTSPAAEPVHEKWRPENLEVGHSYQSQRFGLVTYRGIDVFCGDKTHAFDIGRGEMRYTKKLDDFLTPPHPAPSASREVTVTDEMVLAGCRILHPSLFSRGLEPRPGDGPSTRGIIAEDIKKVRGILTAALAALPEREVE